MAILCLLRVHDTVCLFPVILTEFFTVAWFISLLQYNSLPFYSSVLTESMWSCSWLGAKDSEVLSKNLLEILESGVTSLSAGTQNRWHNHVSYTMCTWILMVVVFANSCFKGNFVTFLSIHLLGAQTPSESDIQNHGPCQ